MPYPRSKSLAGLLVHGGTWAISLRLFASIASAVWTILLARALSPESYGAFLVAYSFSIVGATIVGAGLDQLAVRELSAAVSERDLAAVRRLIARIGRISLLTGLGFIAVASGLQGLLRTLPPAIEPLRSLMMPIVSWTVAGAWLRIGSEAFRGLQDVRLASLLGDSLNSGLIVNLGLTAIAGMFVWSGVDDLAATLWWVAGLTLAVAGVTWLLLVRRVYKQAPPRNELPTASMPAFTGLMFKLYFLSVLTNARAYADLWVLGTTGDGDAVAIYGASLRLSMLLFVPLAIAGSAAVPFFAEAKMRGGRKQVENVARLCATVAAVPTLCAAAVLIVWPSGVLELVYGGEYTAGRVILILLTVSQVLNVLAGPNLMLLIISGGERTALTGMIASTATFLTMAFLLEGLVGLAVASLISRILQIVWMTVGVRLVVGVRTHAHFSIQKIRRTARELSKGSAAIAGADVSSSATEPEHGT